LEEKPWSIGLIVGPSGSGKSVCGRELWPREYAYAPKWKGATVIDCFDKSLGIETIARALSSVGFSTIPAWLRPFEVLSNGEKFRAEIARRLIESGGLIVVDEFTSVVDRQVAKVACHAVQKFVRKQEKQLVAVTCHADVIDWLQPDWVFDPAELSFRWRSLQRRPNLHIEVARVPYEAWRLFAPFHYLTAKLNKAARCYGLWVNGELASFAGIKHMPHPRAKNIKAVSRIVTLPDWQGLGLAFVLLGVVASAYKMMGYRIRNYPAHPSFIRAARSTEWKCVKKPGIISKYGQCGRRLIRGKMEMVCKTQPRPCAIFEYIGPAMEKSEAERLVNSRPGDGLAPRLET